MLLTDEESACVSLDFTAVEEGAGFSSHVASEGETVTGFPSSAGRKEG